MHLFYVGVADLNPPKAVGAAAPDYYCDPGADASPADTNLACSPTTPNETREWREGLTGTALADLKDAPNFGPSQHQDTGQLRRPLKPAFWREEESCRDTERLLKLSEYY